MARHYYLPHPYPDELIGSVFIRACRHRGLSPKALGLLLSGKQRSQWPMLLSTHLEVFANATGISARDFLYSHTAFPYSTRFMSQSETDRQEENLLVHNGKSLFVLIQAATTGGYSLRFCPRCIETDLDLFGESYWHRTHNLPLVELCGIHKVRLMTPVARNATKRTGIPIPPDECLGAPVAVRFSFETATRIGQLSEASLSTRNRQALDAWLGSYRETALARKFPQQGCGLASQTFSASLLEFYGRPTLESAGLLFQPSSSAWPALMVRERCAVRCVTAKHLLLQTFLESEQEPASDIKYAQAGRKPKNYSALDKGLARQLGRALIELRTGNTRVTLRDLLNKVDAWETFRHHRTSLPKTACLVETFKSSEFSARQVGRRPRRKTLAASKVVM